MRLLSLTNNEKLPVQGNNQKHVLRRSVGNAGGLNGQY